MQAHINKYTNICIKPMSANIQFTNFKPFLSQNYSFFHKTFNIFRIDMNKSDCKNLNKYIAYVMCAAIKM